MHIYNTTILHTENISFTFVFQLATFDTNLSFFDYSLVPDFPEI